MIERPKPDDPAIFDNLRLIAKVGITSVVNFLSIFGISLFIRSKFFQYDWILLVGIIIGLISCFFFSYILIRNAYKEV